MASFRPCLPVGLLASCLIVACRHVAPAPLAPEQTAERYLARTFDDPDLRAFLEDQLGEPREPWPQVRWDLRDLTLAAFYLHSDLRVARAAAEVAGAHVSAAGERPNPTLSFLPQRVVSPASGVSPWLAAVQLDWPIETAGKREHRRAAAQARAEAADAGVLGVVWNVRASVYQAVVALRAAEARRALLARTLELFDREVALLDERRSAGEIAEAAVATQRFARAQAGAERAAAERQVLEAQGRLATAVGAPRAAFAAIEVAFPLETPVEESAPGCVDERRAALLGRSDVAVLLAEYAAAEADLRLELAKQYPDLHLGPTYEFDQGENKWGLGISLELPILSQNGGAIDEALARRSEVAARFEALQAQVIGEVDEACALLAGSRGEWEDARGLVDQAQQRFTLAESAFALGAADRLTLLAAELEMQFARGILIDSEERVHLARARLERVTESTRELPNALLAPSGGIESEGAG